MQKAIRKVNNVKKWSEEENLILLSAVGKLGTNWDKISKESFDLKRNKKQCERHFDYLKIKFNKV